MFKAEDAVPTRGCATEAIAGVIATGSHTTAVRPKPLRCVRRRFDQNPDSSSLLHPVGSFENIALMEEPYCNLLTAVLNAKGGKMRVKKLEQYCPFPSPLKFCPNNSITGDDQGVAPVPMDFREFLRYKKFPLMLDDAVLPYCLRRTTPLTEPGLWFGSNRAKKQPENLEEFVFPRVSMQASPFRCKRDRFNMLLEPFCYYLEGLCRLYPGMNKLSDLEKLCPRFLELLDLYTEDNSCRDFKTFLENHTTGRFEVKDDGTFEKAEQDGLVRRRVRRFQIYINERDGL